jgi:nicotinamide-nucleotide adenylyltransferase
MVRGFYIGRFQPYHGGHDRVVDAVAGEVDELVVGVGSADASHTVENPFTAGERTVMVRGALADRDLRVHVVPLQDIDRNALWVSHVRSLCPPFEVAYSNNPLVRRLLSEAGVEVRGTEMYERDTLEGTTIRERMREGEPWRHLVPDPVVDAVEEVDGVARLRQVAGEDG